MTEQKVVSGMDMIDKEVFEEEWKHFVDRFTNTDKDMLHGYMILKAMCAILENAFQIEAPEVVIGEDEPDA